MGLRGLGRRAWCWLGITAGCGLACLGLGAKELNQRGRGLTLSLAFFSQPFGHYDPVCLIQVTLNAAIAALDALAFLPQTVCLVAVMGLGVGLIDAPALHEAIEEGFICGQKGCICCT